MATFDKAQVTRDLGAAQAGLFLREATAAPLEELPELQDILETYLLQVKRLHVENQFIDIDLVSRIGDAVREMLRLYPDVSELCRAGIVGALMYFVIEEDAEGDLDSIVGFDDDAQVVNYVIARFGLDVPAVAIGE